ncbi:MAG: hypothetical protein ACTJGD_05680 [Mesonia hippocampi]|uniref:hypothetical protein n=1 Tax=Mesonia hippocampi TaxID=1628250 RepID=UPI003F9A80E9
MKHLVITISKFTGTYHQTSVGTDAGIGISAVGLYSNLPNNQAVYGIGLSIDLVSNYVDFTYQYGTTTLLRNHSDNPVKRIFNP